MARRVLADALVAGQGAAASAHLNGKIASVFSKLLPAAASAGSLHLPEALGQQQQQQQIHNSRLALSAASQHAGALTTFPASSTSSSNSTRRLGLGPFQPNSFGVTAAAAGARGFASFSRASAHAGCGHSHHHDEPCSDETTNQIRQAEDLQQLAQLVQDATAAAAAELTAGQAAAAFRRAAMLSKDAASTAAAAGLLAQLSEVWPRVLPQAAGKDLADVLLSWTKFQTQDEALWTATLAAVPGQIRQADGQDLANIAYALAAMSDINGGIPGVPRPDVQELLRAVTEEVVSLVQGKGGAAAADGGDDSSSSSSSRSVSVGNLATVRWAHEVFEEAGQADAASAPA